MADILILELFNSLVPKSVLLISLRTDLVNDAGWCHDVFPWQSSHCGGFLFSCFLMWRIDMFSVPLTLWKEKVYKRESTGYKVWWRLLNKVFPTLTSVKHLKDIFPKWFFPGLNDGAERFICSWLLEDSSRNKVGFSAFTNKLKNQHGLYSLEHSLFIHLSSSLLCYIVLILCISHSFQIKSKRLEHEGMIMAGRDEAPSVVFRGTMGL